MLDLIIPSQYHQADQGGLAQFLAAGATDAQQASEMEALRRNGELFLVELSVSRIQLDEGYLVIAFILGWILYFLPLR